MKLLLTALIVSLMTAAGSLYDFKMNALDGSPIDFAKYKGKTLLIVNVASKCGNTPQYADLQKLNELYGDKVTILGFPANNFGGQEPGSNAEIGEFCKANYGVTFQLFLGPDGGSMKLLRGAQTVQVISTEAPLGKALLGKCAGDEVSIQVASIRQRLEVLRIR